MIRRQKRTSFDLNYPAPHLELVGVGDRYVKEARGYGPPRVLGEELVVRQGRRSVVHAGGGGLGVAEEGGVRI